MGEHNVAATNGVQQAQAFMHALLKDLTALEKIIEGGRIETGVRRIGAEQEMFLVDAGMRPASVVPQILQAVNEPRLTSEIGRFNLEANLSPQLFTGGCLRALEAELHELVELARQAAAKHDAKVLLTGILPTLRQSDLTLENLSPGPRYDELNRTLQRMRGNRFYVHIKGLDELQLTHDNVLLEACCTSFQVHLQVSAQEFAPLYNLAQAITAPLLAAAANSPLLFGHRLWHETRIALFQHAVDERSDTRQLRAQPPRVSFGESWIKASVLEIFREEIARFRVVLTKHIEEDSLAVLAAGRLPELSALRLHNGTVWRWNRPCYGVTDGIAHLRIENRVIPAGPSLIDELANAAFFLGLMTALPEEYGDITRVMSFDDAKDNFFAAARHGLKAQFTWLGGQRQPAAALLLEHLLPLARAGLKHAGLESADIDRYLGVLEERVRFDQNGSLWMLRSLAAMQDQGTREQRYQALTATMLDQQLSDTPVHRWEIAQVDESRDWRHNFQTVGQFMSTDLFTVRPDDLVDLAACVMDWRHVRHVPVEDDEGRLIGLVSHRELLKLVAKGATQTAPVTVQEVMKPHPYTISPHNSTLEAIELMQRYNIGCLPVVDKGKLVGIVTAYDFLSLSAELIRAELKG
ncbi:MAG: CBS domain-containing protein [Acidobacteria bacterium]|nr:CBS domain-containing protein [Acidobacteriota bacterium]MBI3424741.1 CBS domain-containing protein [Acidobacteriota bacterium]